MHFFASNAIFIAIALATLLAACMLYYLYTLKQLQKNNLWKFAIDATGDGVWDWDIKKNITTFSNTCKTMLGFNESEITTDTDYWENHIHPDDVKSMEKALHHYLDGKTEQYTHEHRVMCKNNQYKWVLSRGIIVKRDQYGNPLRMVGTHTDITERKDLEKTLANLAHFDPLTGLPNRTLLNDRLKLAMAYAKREKKMLAVMFVDLDQFNEVNDFYGRKIGDKVLKKIAQRLLTCVRESDTVARIDGDEFIILLPLIESEEDVVAVANKIVASVKKPIEIVKPSDISQPVKVMQKSLVVTTSIGVAIYPEHGNDEKLLIINADFAMYQAKHKGKNQVRLYDKALAKQKTDTLIHHQTTNRP
ncbi:MAG: GGDEF domain-containing protein [Betaproteobacteria bacterium HGW-Betaproteobacteria-22]|nr:MAG: GGDEF domain-containing protein [Betaproteobacteria bacterium HGW-Betaproteobacteria-22]